MSGSHRPMDWRQGSTWEYQYPGPPGATESQSLNVKLCVFKAAQAVGGVRSGSGLFSKAPRPRLSACVMEKHSLRWGFGSE